MYASQILTQTKNYGVMHSGPFLTKAIIACVRNRVPGVFEYLDARRLKATEFPYKLYKEIKFNGIFCDEKFDHVS